MFTMIKSLIKFTKESSDVGVTEQSVRVERTEILIIM